MNKKIAASAAALVALGVASGTAFTNSIDGVNAKTGAFASTSVDAPSNVSTIDFTYSATGASVNEVDLTFVDALSSGDEVVVTFYSSLTADPAYMLGTPESATITDSTATVGGFTVATADIQHYSIAVIDAGDTTAAVGG